MEILCGWIKRKAQKKKFDTVLAVYNLIKRREQVSRGDSLESLESPIFSSMKKIFQQIATLPDPPECLLVMGGQPADYDVRAIYSDHISDLGDTPAKLRPRCHGTPEHRCSGVACIKLFKVTSRQFCIMIEICTQIG
jgi:hypothetical protein